jgi:hypothetical protein
MKKTRMTLDWFMKTYGTPFQVRGVYLDDVCCIRTLYKECILQCNTIQEMKEVCKEFRFLSSGVIKELNQINQTSPLTVQRLKLMLKNGKTHSEQLVNFILPKIMLHAHIIADEFNIPEYYAAVQYVAIVYYPDEMQPLNDYGSN